ncbi:hypothetical protein DLD82_12755 [Methanospirillum stamsii]|uniref:Uncharacterized protein n=2 Tax=Methanospirillum stamsii TaxID=1277351 RepID=A0A2V2MUN0_9EURY|nr:hypothetical protein DLD82_12755 [Methanospirillum stamsii]
MIILLLSQFTLIFSVVGDETPVMQVLVSGNISSISEPDPGTYQIQIQNVIPNATVLYDTRSVTVPLQHALITNTTTGPIRLVDNNGDMIRDIVRVTDIRYLEEDKTLEFDLIPLEFQEGSEQVKIREIVPGSYTQTDVTFVYTIPAPENTPVDYCCTFKQVEDKKCVPMRPLCGY